MPMIVLSGSDQRSYRRAILKPNVQNFIASIVLFPDILLSHRSPESTDASVVLSPLQYLFIGGTFQRSCQNWAQILTPWSVVLKIEI